MKYILQTDGITIEKLLKEKWMMGKKYVHELRMGKRISDLEGNLLPWNQELKKGTTLIFDLPKQTSSYLPAPLCELPILFEDEHCLIVSKPANMPTHPNEEGQTNTAMNHVITHVLENGGHYAEHAHRLDMGTSGLLLVAKHPIAKGIFDRMLEDKKIIRTYEAEIEGNIKPAEGTIDAAIGKDRHHATRKRVSPNGQHAVTHYKQIRTIGDHSIVHLILDTGRTHQIRVHLSHIGHPIIGDTLYGGKRTSNGQYRLHAFRLEFQHPFTEKNMIVENQKSESSFL